MRAAARALQEAGVESVASASSSRTSTRSTSGAPREIVARSCPDAFVTSSADIFPQFREFERFTTACMNAFVGPRSARYLDAARGRARAATACAESCT